jgi:hypothetical protein
MTEEKHYALLNATPICATCGWLMANSNLNDFSYQPGKPIRWVVCCGNPVCPEVGISYRVLPKMVELERVYEEVPR